MAVRTQNRGGPSDSPLRHEGGPTNGTVRRDILLEGINSGLTGEDQAILMYTLYAAKVTGPYRNELRALFQAETAEGQGRAQFVANMLASLGGDPITESRPVPHVACRGQTP